MPFEIRTTDVASLLTQSPHAQLLDAIQDLFRALSVQSRSQASRSGYGSPRLVSFRPVSVEKQGARYYLRADLQVQGLAPAKDVTRVILQLAVNIEDVIC